MKAYISTQYHRVADNKGVCISCKVLNWIWAAYITFDTVRDWFI